MELLVFHSKQLSGWKKDIIPLLHVQEGLYTFTQKQVEMAVHKVLASTWHLVLQSLGGVFQSALWCEKAHALCKISGSSCIDGLLVFNFDDLECPRSSCFNRERMHLSLLKYWSIKFTNLTFHCRSGAL